MSLSQALRTGAGGGLGSPAGEGTARERRWWPSSWAAAVAAAAPSGGVSASATKERPAVESVLPEESP